MSTATADDLLARALAAEGVLWVFGYGSLMWRPGFSFEEVVTARLHGFHRSLCILSVHWRGTEACPGLVFGLDRGGSCQGRAFRIAADRAAGVLAELDAREMTHGVYRHTLLPVTIPGATVRALAYVVRRDHPHYAGRLDTPARLRLIAQGRGLGGPCRDYVLSTHAHLEAIGIRDRPLARLARSLAAASG